MFHYQLGDGKQFSFWFDPWCDGQSIIDLFPEVNLRKQYIDKHTIVCDYWVNGRWMIPAKWDPIMARIFNFLCDHYAILGIIPDCITWKIDKQGKYNSKSIFNSLIQPKSKVCWATLAWSSTNLPRHSFVLWLAL